MRIDTKQLGAQGFLRKSRELSMIPHFLDDNNFTDTAWWGLKSEHKT